MQYQNQRSKLTREQRMFKFAQSAVSLQNPKQTANDIGLILRFLMQRISYDKRGEAMNTLKYKIHDLSEYEIYSNKLPDTAALGQAITFIKNVLAGQHPGFIRSVINNLGSELYV